jgi:restriction endonuclease S subunit
MKADRIGDSEDHISELAVENAAVNFVPPRSILCVVRSGILARSFPVALTTRGLTFNQDINAIVLKDNRVLPEFVFHILKYLEPTILELGVKRGGTVHSLRGRFLHELEFPLPPLEEQERLVAELEGYRQIIESARQILTHYKPTLRINPDWPMKSLKEIATVDWGNTDLTKASFVVDGKYLGVSAAGPDGRMAHKEHEVGVTVISAIGANCGRVFFPDEPFTAIKNTITLTPNTREIEGKFLFYSLVENRIPKRGGGQPFVSKGDTETYQISIPPIPVQRRIVAELEAERALVEANRELAARFEQKLQSRLAEIWGEKPEDKPTAPQTARPSKAPVAV